MKPKQVAILDGKVVARTYDSDNKKGRFALRVIMEELPERYSYIYRDNYFNLRKMVDKLFPGTKWVDASSSEPRTHDAD